MEPDGRELRRGAAGVAGKAEAGNPRLRKWDECCCREGTRTFPRQLGETLAGKQPFYDTGSVCVCKAPVNVNGTMCGRIFDGKWVGSR